jgi:hypothetical protein
VCVCACVCVCVSFSLIDAGLLSALSHTYTHTFIYIYIDAQWPSHLSSFPAFGPVVPDGYGLCYNVKSNAIMAGISSFRSLNNGTSAPRLAEALRQSLIDISLTLTKAKL